MAVLAWENLQEVFVMLVVVVPHLLLFDVFIILFFIHCFSTSSLTLPWAIARFLHRFYTFSPAHCRVIHDTFILTFLGPSVTVLLRLLRIWECFLLSGVFYLTLFPDIWHNLILPRLPWEPAVLPWRLRGLPLRFETQTQPICSFESHSVHQKLLVGRFYLRVTACS